MKTKEKDFTKLSEEFIKFSVDAGTFDKANAKDFIRSAVQFGYNRAIRDLHKKTDFIQEFFDLSMLIVFI